MSRLMSSMAVVWSDGEVEREGVLELLLPVRVGRERVAGHGLARGVELEQLLGHVAHGLLDARLRLFPRRAAEAVERRPRAAAVLLDEVEARHGDEQLVVARVAKLEELERLVRPDGHLLQADELADAVVDVDDEIADLQVAQVGEERGRRRSPRAVLRAPLLFEEVRLGEDLQLRGRQAEPARQDAGGDEHARGKRVFTAVDVHAAQFVVVEHFDEALGAAGRGGDEHHDLAPGARGLHFVNPLGQTAGVRQRGLGGRTRGSGLGARRGPSARAIRARLGRRDSGLGTPIVQDGIRDSSIPLSSPSSSRTDAAASWRSMSGQLMRMVADGAPAMPDLSHRPADDTRFGEVPLRDRPAAALVRSSPRSA